MSPVRIWTDGSVGRQGGPGGWGVVLVAGKHRKEIFGSEDSSTSQRMELHAAIAGLSAIKGSQRVEVYSDSQYLVNGMNSNKPHGGISGKTPNADLWRLLGEQAGRHEVTWIKIRGHSGYPENERADTLAVMERRDRERDEGLRLARDNDVSNLVDFAGAQAKAKLAKEGWPAESGELEKKFNHPLAKLYPLIDGYVNTPGGPGVLVSVLGDNARVLLDSTRHMEGYGKGGKNQRYRPTTDIPAVDIKPIGGRVG